MSAPNAPRNVNTYLERTRRKTTPEKYKRSIRQVKSLKSGVEGIGRVIH